MVPPWLGPAIATLMLGDRQRSGCPTPAGSRRISTRRPCRRLRRSSRPTDQPIAAGAAEGGGPGQGRRGGSRRPALRAGGRGRRPPRDGRCRLPQRGGRCPSLRRRDRRRTPRRSDRRRHRPGCGRCPGPPKARCSRCDGSCSRLWRAFVRGAVPLRRDADSAGAREDSGAGFRVGRAADGLDVGGGGGEPPGVVTHSGRRLLGGHRMAGEPMRVA